MKYKKNAAERLKRQTGTQNYLINLIFWDKSQVSCVRIQLILWISALKTKLYYISYQYLKHTEWMLNSGSAIYECYT